MELVGDGKKRYEQYQCRRRNQAMEAASIFSFGVVQWHTKKTRT
jgi:hypothetical protein